MWLVAWGESRPEQGGTVHRDTSNLYSEDDALARARSHLERGHEVFAIWNYDTEIYDESAIREMLGAPRKR
jgi:hypothetical protein